MSPSKLKRQSWIPLQRVVALLVCDSSFKIIMDLGVFLSEKGIGFQNPSRTS